MGTLALVMACGTMKDGYLLPHPFGQLMKQTMKAAL